MADNSRVMETARLAFWRDVNAVLSEFCEPGATFDELRSALGWGHCSAVVVANFIMKARRRAV